MSERHLLGHLVSNRSKDRFVAGMNAGLRNAAKAMKRNGYEIHLEREWDPYADDKPRRLCWIWFS